MGELTEMAQLQQLVRDGFADWGALGDVKAIYRDGLVLFNYTTAATYARRWNWFERVSRGLILDAATGEIVARPFDKFFNWGEGGRTTDAPLVNVAEKVDGSLGIAYWHKGQLHVATRGNFESDQAQWATAWLRDKLGNHHEIDALYGTMLFEIVYPENRVVVDYGDRAELVLLAIRDRHTGEYMEQNGVSRIAEKYGFGSPVVWPKPRSPDWIIDYCKRISANVEGFVGVFADGQRFKFKSAAYLELQKLICGLSFKNTLQAVINGSVEQVRAAIPDEFLGQFNQWVEYIYTETACVCDNVESAFVVAPKESRKEFAMWVQANHGKLAPYLFAKFDGRDYSPLVYEREFR